MTKLESLFMLRTANSEAYSELVTNKKYFTRQAHLFVVGLTIGISRGLKSSKKPNKDIVRLAILENNLGLFRDVIDLLAEIVCIGLDDKECESLILSYADGGIEYLWDEYKTQATLDIPRIFEETTNSWDASLNDIFKKIESKIDN